MSLTSELEDKFNLKIEDLNAVEKASYFKMLEVVQKSQLSPEKLKEYIPAMREAVERELIDEPEFNYIFIFKVANRKQILLKARLKNYLLLEAFLSSSDRAKEALETMLGNIGTRT